MTELIDEEILAIRKHPLAKCEECPLFHAEYVPTSGPSKPTLALVGEWPSFNDTILKRALSGPTGTLLVKVLEHHGIKKEEALFTNAISCRPPDPKKIPKGAAEACKPRLFHEIKESGAPTVVTFGGQAAASMLNGAKVGTARPGPPKTNALLPGVRIIPTLHPGMALRSADSFPFIVTDIKKINTVFKPWVEPTMTLADSEKHALLCLKTLYSRHVEFVTVDIETNIEKDTSFGHPDQHGMLCVGIGYGPKKVLVIGEEAMKSQAVRKELLKFLKSTKIICHNGKFDLSGLVPILGEMLPLWYDTMLGSYCLDERGGIHSLKYLGQEFHGAPQWAEEIKKYTAGGKGYGAIPRDKLYPYNATDCSVTYDEALRQFALFEREENKGLRELHDFLVLNSRYLATLEKNGLFLDVDVIDDLEVGYLDALRGYQFAIEENIMDNLGKSYDSMSDKMINLNSPLQVKKALADYKVVTDSTDEKHLVAIQEKLADLNMTDTPLGEFIEILMNHREAATALGTFVTGMREKLYKGKVHTSFLLHGTTTGRLSSRNPNVQNIPREKKIRKMFIPESEDNVMIQCDYSQAELRIMSWLAGDNYFRDIFNAGDIDVFDDLTPRLFRNYSTQNGIHFKRELEGRKTVLQPVADAEWKETRMMVKTFVYGLAYGRTEYGIAAAFKELDIKAAKEAKDNFFSTIPAIVAYFDDIKHKVNQNDDLITPFGRRRRFMLISKENRQSVFNQAQAFIPQSTSSDMCLRAMTWIQDEITTRNLPAKIVNIIHDAVLIDCHKSVAEEVKEIMETKMRASGKMLVGDYVRMDVESKIGKSWAET